MSGADIVNPATQIENQGYSTQSEMVLLEPVQFQYIPMSDIMKRVQKRDGTDTRDVGKGKQGEKPSTGKVKNSVRKSRGKPITQHIPMIFQEPSPA